MRLSSLLLLVPPVALAAACGSSVVHNNQNGHSGGNGGSGASGAGTTGTGGSGASGGSGGAGGTPIVCSSDAQCSGLSGQCSLGVCSNGYCTSVPFGDGQPCEDGLPCTLGDFCSGGSCVSGGQGCPPSPDPCLQTTCNPDGSCGYAPAPDGTACDDGDICSVTSQCNGGKCVASVEVDCSAWSSACAIGTCGAAGCFSAPLPDGQPCDDGQFCTSGDACFAGFCQGGMPVQCPGGGGPCLIGYCDEMANACILTTAPNGTACDDGNACTSGSVCGNGICSGGFPSPNGTPCDDGNACTINDTCSAGQCVGSGGGIVYLSEDFSDNSAGWLLGPDWQIGPAQASSGGVFGADPALDHTATADNGVAGVVIGGNETVVLHGIWAIESPVIDTSAAPSVILSYWRWLNSDYDPFMHNYVQVWNGSVWVSVWSTGQAPGIQDSPPEGQGWTFVTHDLSAFKNAGMKVRFGFDINQQGVYTIGSWNLDDVTVSSAICP